MSATFNFNLQSDVHLTNVAVQKTAPDYDPEKVCNVAVLPVPSVLLHVPRN